MSYKQFKENLQDPWFQRLSIVSIIIICVCFWGLQELTKIDRTRIALERIPQVVCEDSKTICYTHIIEGKVKYFLLQKDRKEYLVQIIAATKGS